MEKMTMSGTVVALGEEALIKGYSLAGASLAAVDTDDDVRSGWNSLPKTTAVVILTPRAAKALGKALFDLDSPMSVVLPS
ncbi:MAG TPA: hypothetical protein VMV52_05750 [Candidatus Nanopelagicaceae bacterium]|nr:hypothetical protein [Candidatus Nanopelagicaceae bacterium]